MDSNDRFYPKVLRLYLELAQYPILGHVIRERMRQELFARGVINRERLENEVLEKAIESQTREGLTNPLYEEPAIDWNNRVQYIRDHLTDFYFAYNLPHTLFERIARDVLSKRAPDQEVSLTFNPEFAPWDVLFAEGERYENLPPEERVKIEHDLREIIVVLLKAMISDQLNFIALAKEVFTISDLSMIRKRRIGRGKIGGKAAGMLLAWKLLQEASEESGLDPSIISIPDSYYIGSDVVYEVHELNDFYRFMNQKYKPRDEIIAEYPAICELHLRAQLPDYIAGQLRALLDKIGPVPLIFRSSSLLEDRFGTAFAGKYDSFFLPNQGTPEENFEAAKNAMLKIYASTFSPDALIYRQQKGLIDFDERMAILIQKVEGQHFGDYFFPMIAGVGFSRNPFRWNQRIRREGGLLRLVCGLGTRAVNRVERDYPRMIALSHPTLRPESRVEQLRRYSQHLIDVLDMADNSFKTLPITHVINDQFPILRLIADQDTGQHLQSFMWRPAGVDPSQLVFTFDTLAKEKTFTATMRNLLALLENRYQGPVDIEYALEVTQTWPRMEFQLFLLQCRPLEQHEGEKAHSFPEDLPLEDILFTAKRQVPEGILRRIRYIVFVQPEVYLSMTNPHKRIEVGRLIGRLNERLEGERFILIGPGRWGTSNIQLGVKVSYADIYNSRALIEIAFSTGGDTPEMAYGTHFFQDLVESKIFPLALFPQEKETVFQWEFFNDAPNVLPDLLPEDAVMQDVVTVIDVPAVTGGRRLEIIMDADQDYALGYFRHYE